MTREPALTDHALIRFFEREMGIDVEGIRERLLNDHVKAAIEFGAESIRKGSGRWVVRDGHIVTFLSKKQGVPTKHLKIRKR